ncbi:MAG: hypothetical protein J7599_25290 [Niabella sp.]|nr:hypothetical protein [Niabella sp.]
MNQVGILILMIAYVLVVAFGIRALLADKVLPVHLKVLGIIVILIFNIIPVGLYVLLRTINSRNK